MSDTKARSATDWSELEARWRREVHDPYVERFGQRQDEFRTAGGIPLKPVYTPADREGRDPAEQEGLPGSYPYTRGVYSSKYRDSLWTIRQYAVIYSDLESIRRYPSLLRHRLM